MNNIRRRRAIQAGRRYHPAPIIQTKWNKDEQELFIYFGIRF